MKQLAPLIESSESDHGRKLLRAARADRPSRGAAGRALAAMGVTSAATAAAGVASAGTAASAASAGLVSLPLLAAKWLVVGALGGGLLASGASLLVSKPPAKELQSPPSRPVASASVAAPSASAREAKSLPVANENENESDVAAPAMVGKTAKPSAAASGDERAPPPFASPSQAAFAGPEQSKLLRDVALLDAARRALRESDTAQASELLNRYDSERETHVLDREARLLHIDVLVARGQRAQARVLAQQYLVAFPGDAHAERLRALVDDRKAP
jgi:hypothetical protein